jgi:predicted Zn-dependent protease
MLLSSQGDGKIKKLKNLLSILSLWLIALFPAEGTLYSPSEAQKAMEQGVLSADIEVLSVQTVAHPLLFAKRQATARVLNIHQVKDDGGWFPQEGETIETVSLGGEREGTGVFYSGLPRPYVGKHYRALLRREDTNTFAFVGSAEGFIPLSSTRGYSRNRTDGSNGAGTGAFLFWDKTYLPIPYFISFPTFRGRTAFVNAIDSSFRTWRTPENTVIDFIPMGCTSVSNNRNDGINTIAFITSDWSFDSSAIAVTRNFYVSGNSGKAGMILDTDILINAVNFEFTSTGESTKHDIQNILTHEIGHLIGLGHEVDPKDSDATMFASASPGETKKRDLASNDLEGLVAAYGGSVKKLNTFSSTASCNLESTPYSCLAAEQRQKPAPFATFFAACFLAALIAGRIYLSKRLL